MSGNSREAGRSVIDRTFGLLATFNRGHPRPTLSELAACAEMPVATVHRMLHELQSAGMVERDATGRYSIGLKMWEIARLSWVSAGLGAASLPVIQDVHRATRGNVYVAVREGNDALCIEKVTGHWAAPVSSRIGGRRPLHTTSVGKVLLAAEPAEFVTAYLRHLGCPEASAKIEADQFCTDLADIQRNGYAIARDEKFPGSRSVAVPISASSRVVASLAVMSPVDPDRVLPRLTSAAATIGARLSSGRFHPINRVPA
jgi:DNA-binding IclR family transcriptional regulator